MKHYLVVFDRRSGSIVRFDEFAVSDDALTARFDAEDEFADNSDIEIVVLGASSEEILWRTHGRYFRRTKELAVDALSALREFEAASRVRAAL
ncbi:hypothetical protein BJ973_003642 [Actinoplanes tereljensis]|uniref:Uncharacterized protein n=1 Tax=Paractinoplanes tereljensis TaxID=571912 RepID=A0A919NVZ4_9ACTN|nr:hypothetical protein [Actinoplanes tereljensis]GIF25363.1 hypothetical protein Ate02nite_80930 [Actinoplanes tereljensis]